MAEIELALANAVVSRLVYASGGPGPDALPVGSVTVVYGSSPPAWAEGYGLPVSVGCEIWTMGASNWRRQLLTTIGNPFQEWSRSTSSGVTGWGAWTKLR